MARAETNIIQKGWPLEKKLYENIYPEPNSGCWIWGGYSNGKGYGVIYSKRTPILAHRFSYEYHSGLKLSSSKEMVLHKCNNTYCVNPAHLYAGTQSMNMRQCFREGRGGHVFNKQRQVVQLDMNGVLIAVFHSVMEAHRITQTHQSSISFACNGRYKQANGYKWKYLDETTLANTKEEVV